MTKSQIQFTHKIVTSIVIGSLLFANMVTPLYGQGVPPPPPIPPPAPSAPPEPSSPPPPPDAPSPPPSPSPVPSAPPAPSYWPTPMPSPSSSGEQPEPTPPPNQQSTPDTDFQASDSGDSGSTAGDTLGETTGGQNGSSGRGDPFIETGDADSSAIIINSANTNDSGNTSGAEDIYVGNSENGSGSTNSGDVNTTNDSSTIQTNDADVANNLNLESVSGQNTASRNTGTDATIITGDSTTTATVINGVNTNLDGVSVIEFNVDDTHTGDIILAFPDTSGCTATVCGTNGSLTAENTENGDDSTNDASITSTHSDTTFQNNSADIVNDIVLVADSGNNETSRNTGGDNSITTGDANVVVTVGNFVNNNIIGTAEVLVAVVNIFGDLIGNILLPESTLIGGSTTAVNTENGENSTNDASITSTNTNTTTQTNTATIANNLTIDANTGGNTATSNTAGFSEGGTVIETGDAAIDVNTVNIANTNLLGGAWWLVFVNDASGNWVGQIMGAPTGAAMAGSTGTQFIMNPDGTIVAQNVGNGSGSVNDTSVSTTNTSSTTQTNTATVTNNIALTANTGSNDASRNTGGSNSITTGDASAMVNIMNFVNNNFVGGKVVVSIVNVFGSWFGNFVPPGEEAQQSAIGGADSETAHVGGINTAHHGSPQFQNDSSGSDNDTQPTSATVVPSFTEESISETTGSVGRVKNWILGSQGNNPPSGGVEEDTTISVPITARTASARTVLPAWFWKVFAVALIFVIIKKLYQVVKNNSHDLTPVKVSV